MYLLKIRLRCCREIPSERFIQAQRLIDAWACDQRPSMQSPLHKFNSAMTARS